MISHKDPGVDGQMILVRILLKPVSIGGKVIVSAKTYLAVVTALNDVLSNARQADSRLSSHRTSLFIWNLMEV